MTELRKLETFTKSYDAGGRLSYDSSRGITGITYNNDGLPIRVKFSDWSQQEYEWDGLGNHLSTRFYGVSYTGKPYTKMKRGYTGDGRVIDNGVDVYERYPGGYMQDSTYYWYVKDYQGNNIAVMDGNKKLIQQTDYYPYGEPWREPAGQPWLYSGNERLRLDGINEYDFNARRFNSVEGRFSSWDAMNKKYPWVSPYSHCFGDPVNYSDPTGLFPDREEAFKYSSDNLMGADPMFDEDTGEWYLAMDVTGKNPYTGTGDMTRFYGQDSPYNSEVFNTRQDPITVMNAFNIAANAKVNIIASNAKSKLPGSVLSNTKLVELAMGKEIGLYFKAFKIGGVIIDGAYILSQYNTIRNEYRNGTLSGPDMARFSLNVTMTLARYDGWGGYLLSVAYFLWDMAYGNQFWEKIEKERNNKHSHNDKPNQIIVLSVLLVASLCGTQGYARRYVHMFHAVYSSILCGFFLDDFAILDF